MRMILENQPEEEVELLPRPAIELAFIRATRGDDGFGLAGTLCRGEFMETLLRALRARYKGMDATVSQDLPQFLEAYIYPVYRESTLTKERQKMRASKKLN